jgi:AAA15 family ATPase/GTPase
MIDEIESSLHSRLVPRIIELFRNPESNPSGAQILFTTHDTSLLGTSLGISVLRRDEVWFMEKNRHGESQILSLSDFKPRKEENRERQYLGGSYGAVPAVFVDSLVEVLRDHFKGDVEGANPSS